MMRGLMRAGLVVAGIGAVACGRSIEVVVPDGFSGEVRVVFDPEKGEPLKSSGFKWVVEIPATGEIRVRDQTPFLRKLESVRYQDGTPASIARRYVLLGSRLSRDGGHNS